MDLMKLNTNMYTIWRCAWRILVAIGYHSREISGLRLFETCCLMGDLVSATPPKPLDGFWWHFTWRMYTIWRCAWRILVAVRYHSREIIGLKLFKYIIQWETSWAQLLLNRLMDFDETLHERSASSVDVHEEFVLLLVIIEGR